MAVEYTSPFTSTGPGLDWLVDPKRAALIVVDIQNDMCHPDGALAKMGTDMEPILDTVERIKGLVAEARRVNVPVIFTQLTFDDMTMPPAVRLQREKNGDKNLCIKDTWGAELYEFEPEANDRVVEKHRYDAFFETELDMNLKSLGAETLIVTGIASNVCAQATGLGAYMRGYFVVFLNDATSTYSDDAHYEALAYADRFLGQVANSADVLELWGKV
ncbi:MAG: isochorismatase family cysteine hydrolase [Anaerolineae bacterium]